MNRWKSFGVLAVFAVLCVGGLFASAAVCGEGSLADKYIDLHLHLDGAVTVEIARELAGIQNLPLAASSDEELRAALTVPEDCESLNDFLNCFAVPLSLMQTPEGLRAAVRLVMENIRSQGVVYAEIRFAPQLHKDKGMTQEDAVRAALEGLKESPLKANLILCCMRGGRHRGGKRGNP